MLRGKVKPNTERKKERKKERQSEREREREKIICSVVMHGCR